LDLGLLIVGIPRTQRHTTLGRSPLHECSACRRDFYLTTHNTHKRERDVHAPGGFRTPNPSMLAAEDQRGHRDRRL